MNKIFEIISSKKVKTKAEESIYETYRRTLCINCSNKYNDKDLCKITVTRDNKAKCFNYEKCMQIKCKTCKYKEKCKERCLNE